MKILVVDDEKLLVKGIKFNLENEGYEVITGADGMEAVELAGSESPDLIVLQKFLAHADTGICNDNLIDDLLFRGSAGRYPAEYLPAPFIVLDGVAENIDENLAHMQRTAPDIRILKYIGSRFISNGNAILHGAHLDDRGDILRQLPYIECLIRERDIRVFQLAEL